MACQTVVIRFALRMTVHTPFHCHLNPWLRGRLFTFANRSVTRFAFHFPKYHVAAMGKEDVVGLLVDAIPTDLLSRFIKRSDLSFFRILGEGILMALQAGRQRGHARKRLVLKMLVAGDTFNALFSVFLVVERNGLF